MRIKSICFAVVMSLALGVAAPGAEKEPRIVAFMLMASSSGSRATWEYKNIQILGRSHEAELDALGKEGWEVAGYALTGNDTSRYVFKRIKKDRANRGGNSGNPMTTPPPEKLDAQGVGFDGVGTSW